MKFYKMVFCITLITGTLIAVSSYSWMSMWIGLEINLLSIIPLLTTQENLYPSESAMKYFITQALASTILLFSIIMMINVKEFAPQNSNYWLMLIMDTALLTKMGAAPFHMWFPEVMEGLNWMNCLLLLTWQKIAPMILLMYTLSVPIFITGIVLFSTAIGGIMGLNQVSLRKIMAYSSINHIAWMIASMLNSQAVWLMYFLIYSIISLSIILILNSLNVYFLKQLFNALNMSKSMKFCFIFNFLSLGGLPPFLGFFPKWITINSLIDSNFYMLSITLIVFTLITLFFYLRMTFSTMVINSNENLVFSSMILNPILLVPSILSLGGLIMCPLLFNFI